MPQDNKNKFYQNLTGKGNEPFKNYPIKNFTFDTDKSPSHPVLESTNVCTHRLGALWTQQEELMVDGLSHWLICERRQAVRIALFEVGLRSYEDIENIIPFAQSGSNKQGHTCRDREKTISLPREEKEQAIKKAKEFGLTDKTYLRLAVIWLAKGIKNETITKITNCKRKDSTYKGRLALRQEWSRNNQGTESKIKPLIEAQKKGKDKSDELKEARYKERKELHEEAKDWARYTGVPYEVARDIFSREDIAPFDIFTDLVQEETDKLILEENTQSIDFYMDLGLSEQEALEHVKREQESNWQPTEEDERMSREWMSLLEQERTAEGKKNSITIKEVLPSNYKTRPNKRQELIDQVDRFIDIFNECLPSEEYADLIKAHQEVKKKLQQGEDLDCYYELYPNDR